MFCIKPWQSPKLNIMPVREDKLIRGSGKAEHWYGTLNRRFCSAGNHCAICCTTLFMTTSTFRTFQKLYTLLSQRLVFRFLEILKTSGSKKIMILKGNISTYPKKIESK